MEFLKWVGSILAALLGLSVMIGGGIVTAAFTITTGAVLAVIGVVVFLAAGIKEYFEGRFRHRAK